MSCHDPAQPPRWLHTLDADAIVHEGFDPAQAILPDDGRSFHGYRLLREYFAFPARFLFFSIGGLRARSHRATGDAFERPCCSIATMRRSRRPSARNTSR